MDAVMDISAVSKVRHARGMKKPELETIDSADLARLVDPDSDCDEQYVVSHNLSVAEDETIENDDENFG